MEAAYYWKLAVIKTSQITPGHCFISDMWAAMKAANVNAFIHWTEKRDRDGVVKKKRKKKGKESCVSKLVVECVPKHHMGWYVRCGWDSTLAREDDGERHTPPLALISHILTLQIDSHSSAAAPVFVCLTIQIIFLRVYVHLEGSAT